MQLAFFALVLGASFRSVFGEYLEIQFLDSLNGEDADCNGFGTPNSAVAGTIIRTVDIDYPGTGLDVNTWSPCTPASVYFKTAEDVRNFNVRMGTDFIATEGNRIYMNYYKDTANTDIDFKLYYESTCESELFSAAVEEDCDMDNPNYLYTAGEGIFTTVTTAAELVPIADVDIMIVTYYDKICNIDGATPTDDGTDSGNDLEPNVKIYSVASSPTWAGEPSLCLPAYVDFRTMEDRDLFNDEFKTNYNALTSNSIYMKWKFDASTEDENGDAPGVGDVFRNYDIHFYYDSNCEHEVETNGHDNINTANQEGSSLKNFSQNEDGDAGSPDCEHLYTNFLFADGSVAVNYIKSEVVYEPTHAESYGAATCVASMHTASGCSYESHAVTIVASGLPETCTGAYYSFVDRESRLLFIEEYSLQASGITGDFASYAKFYIAEDGTIDFAFYSDSACTVEVENLSNQDANVCLDVLDHGNTALSFYRVACYDSYVHVEINALTGAGTVDIEPTFDLDIVSDASNIDLADAEVADCVATWYVSPFCDDEWMIASVTSTEQEDDICIGLTTLEFNTWNSMRLFNEKFPENTGYSSKTNNVVFMKQYRNVIGETEIDGVEIPLITVDLHFYNDSECTEFIFEQTDVLNGNCVPTGVSDIYYQVECSVDVGP